MCMCVNIYWTTNKLRLTTYLNFVEKMMCCEDRGTYLKSKMENEKRKYKYNSCLSHAKTRMHQKCVELYCMHLDAFNCYVLYWITNIWEYYLSLISNIFTFASITILALDDNHDNKRKLYTYTGRTSIQVELVYSHFLYYNQNHITSTHCCFLMMHWQWYKQNHISN